MKSSFDIGMNKTGIAIRPLEASKTVKGAEDAELVPGSITAAAENRKEYAREAEPIGTVPPPASVKGVVKTAVTALKGDKANVFIDKLGERLGFERGGVRLYELILTKAEVYPTWEGGPTRDDLIKIQRDELAHMGLMIESLEKLGADPTVMTPSANLASNLASGVRKVIADPRTDLRQCLEAILVAELADNACWENLIELAEEIGQDELANRFRVALANEQEHLLNVKRWVQNAVIAAVNRDLPTEHEQPSAPA